jgi:hypothetical protein
LKKEDLTTVSFVTTIHNGEADIGKTEAWERSTIINNNTYHQSHYLIMELARGYQTPNSSDWKSLRLLTKDMDSEESHRWMMSRAGSWRVLLPTWPLARPGHWNKLIAGACAFGTPRPLEQTDRRSLSGEATRGIVVVTGVACSRISVGMHQEGR